MGEHEQVALTTSSNPLQQFVERLKPLHVLLSQNSYIKDTTRRLKRLIDDASSPTMILVMGKERVGKTTVINALLGRSLLSASSEHPTSVNTFIRYGEEECVRAYFLDGMVATFDLKKIELLTTSTKHSAQVIRAHIDYIEVIVKHDLLKTITIVDSIALEVTESRVAYFSDILINRIDQIFWVIRNGSPATAEEVALLEQYAERGLKPSFIINAIDEKTVDATSFFRAESARYGHLVEMIVAVSSAYALEAEQTNNPQRLIDSNFHELQQLIDHVSMQQSQKNERVVERFLEWLALCQKEIQQIPTREPYISAWQSVSQYRGDEGFEFTRQERDQAILTSYEQEYEHVCQSFKSVETLYQLLQKLTIELYLRDEEVEMFEDAALRYQQAVREYRKLHMEYVQAYGLFDQQHRKTLGKGIEKGDLQAIMSHPMLGRAKVELDERQAKLPPYFLQIKQYERLVLEQLYSVQNHLNDLAEKRLKGIMQQVADLNIQRKREVRNVKSYVNKLAEFACVEEAQHFIQDAILPYLQSGALPLTERQVQQVEQMVEKIVAVQLQQHEIEVPTEETSEQSVLHQEFETTYTLIPLSLTESDVVSDIPECPKQLALL